MNNLDPVRTKFVLDTSSACLSCFDIPTDRVDSDFGVAGLGVTMLFANRLQAYVYYESLVGASKLTSNAFTLGIRGQF
jgi:hypothetical protein